jgi:hypothetical protein
VPLKRFAAVNTNGYPDGSAWNNVATTNGSGADAIVTGSGTCAEDLG